VHKNVKMYNRFHIRLLITQDVLVIAGDVSDDLSSLRDMFLKLKRRYKHVFFCPGNLELWVRKDNCNSLEKFSKVLEVCEQSGIRTRPAHIGKSTVFLQCASYPRRNTWGVDCAIILMV